MKKTIKSIILILLIGIITLYLVFKDDFESKIVYLFSYSKIWLLAGVICIFLYYFLKSLVIYYCTKKFKKDYKLKEAFFLNLSVQFVNNITPFSTGGQPYTLYKLNKQGLSAPQSTNVVIQDFIVYQIALILLSTIAIISNTIFNIFPNDHLLKKLVLLGYLINFGVIIILFIISFNKKGNKFILKIIYKIIIKFTKKKDLKEKFDTFINDFHISAKELMKSKTHFIKIIFINIIALIILYLIPFTLIMGLNFYLNPLLVIVCSSYVMLIGSFVPLPGGAGGLEFSFMAFYGTYISSDMLASIMISWRIITYYLGTFIGALAISKE